MPVKNFILLVVSLLVPLASNFTILKDELLVRQYKRLITDLDIYFVKHSGCLWLVNRTKLLAIQNISFTSNADWKKTICQRIASVARLTFVELRSTWKARMHCETFLSGNFLKCSFRAISWNMKYFHKILFYLKVGLYDEIFLSRTWNFYFERKASKYFRKRNVCRQIFSLFTQSSFIHSIMITFHS